MVAFRKALFIASDSLSLTAQFALLKFYNLASIYWSLSYVGFIIVSQILFVADSVVFIDLLDL